MKEENRELKEIINLKNLRINEVEDLLELKEANLGANLSMSYHKGADSKHDSRKETLKSQSSLRYSAFSQSYQGGMAQSK